MTLWTSAYLLAQLKQHAKLPTATEWTDAILYNYLQEAQELVYEEIAAHVPEAIMTGPTLLTTADGGYSYTFGTDADGDNIAPLGQVEIRESKAGAVLIPAADFDQAGDFVMYGDRIRFPGQVSRTFSDGPYARFVSPPGLLDASTQPTLKPKRARKLIVYRALVLFAEPPEATGDYELKYRTAAWGDPSTPGDIGLLGALKMQYFASGGAGMSNPDPIGWPQQIRSY